MKSKFRFWFGCISIAYLVSACGVKAPDDIIPESKMENLLYDYHIAKAMGENLSYEENYKKALYINAVFKKYEITEAKFDSSMVWYTRNAEVLSKMYEHISKRLKADEDNINHLVAVREKKPKKSTPGDSIDVWPWKRVVRLTGMAVDNKYTFIIPSDSNFKDRDTLIWEARYKFLLPDKDPSAKAVMAMQIVYENDSVIGNLKTIAHAGVQRIRLYSDTLGKIKEVKGFIYFTKKYKEKGSILIDGLSLMRYHCQDSLSFVARDSLKKIETRKADSLKMLKRGNATDSAVKELPIRHQDRQDPGDMNRKKTGTVNKKSEQVEVERHIQEERSELRRQRILNQQRNSQYRHKNTR